ncbi:YqgE/AlgH family protein [Microvirga antarctica]|uniref:YqgE/AlgH family protein n=1 Tax=Microvirga antarctica TaxID=2819233 RepID=UPI001B3126BC|nr:YqgE/AlgH family protein [Microvirga antarctica]
MSVLPTESDMSEGYLDGQLLLAMPGMTDERFARSVIYLCAHSAEGAMGIVLTKPAPNVSMPDLLVQLEIVPESERISLPKTLEAIQVLIGGPVETSRGFVLHSPDFHMDQSTLPIDDGVCLTATVDILRAIARGEGPKDAILALGYAGWSAGQLEGEIQANGWLNCPADVDLLFGTPVDARYEEALRRIGIEPAMLSSEAGHA